MTVSKYLLILVALFDLEIPQCQEGETNCKRVSERRKKKQKQKEVKFFELPEDDPEKLKMDNLVNWLKKGGAELPKMEMVYFFKNFRGAAATKKIFPNKQGDTLLYVPYNLLITYEMALRISSLARRLEKKKINLYNFRHTVVALAILEQKDNPRSFWKPYIDIFPDNFNEFPLKYTDKEFNLLQNSSYSEEIKYQQEQYKMDYDKLIEAVPDFESFTYEEFIWSRLAVQSRIFGITVDGQQTQVMVPFADMLNHARVQPTEWNYNQQRQGFVIMAKNDIEKGAEIYDTYGRKYNRMFYSSYGFLEDGNDMNVADIYTCISARDKLFTQKTRLTGWKQCIKFRIDNSTMSFQEPLSVSRLLSTNTLSEFLRLEKSLETKSYTKTPPYSIEGEKVALQTLISLLENQLAEYGTSIEEDYKLLKKEKDRATANVINLRKMEKETINEFIQMAKFLGDVYEKNESHEDVQKNIEQREKMYQRLKEYLKNVYIPLQLGEL